MFKRRFLITMLIGAMLTLSFGAPAMAASGSAVFTNEEVTPFSISYPGGGTWDTGTTVTGTQKHVWSYYLHPTNCHSATARIQTNEDKDYASAGNWAEADVYGDPDYTGYTWWDNEC